MNTTSEQEKNKLAEEIAALMARLEASEKENTVDFGGKPRDRTFTYRKHTIIKAKDLKI